MAAHPYLQALTDLGDSAVLWPLSIALFFWLLAERPVRAALVWAVTVGVCSTLIGMLKIYFFACPAGPSLHSPSGHTGFSVLVYGGLAAVFAIEARQGWRRIAIVAAGAALIAAIGRSRIALHQHSAAEVVLGGLIGLAGLAVFVRTYRDYPGRGQGIVLLCVATPVIAALFHGDRLHIEPYLQHLSALLGVRSVACR
jgi:membrane-associated phospholipid phosphatase